MVKIMESDSQILLGVNIDHVATLRQARGTPYPDPVEAAALAENSGADSITLHLREDRRHIQDRDVLVLRERLRTRMNLEMAVTPEMLAFAEQVRPQDCCLVPERREELTTEGGLDVAGQLSRVREACSRLAGAGVRVSLFIDADIEQVQAAADAGAPCIEIHTGHFADATDAAEQAASWGALPMPLLPVSRPVCRSMPVTGCITAMYRRSRPCWMCASSISVMPLSRGHCSPAWRGRWPK